MANEVIAPIEGLPGLLTGIGLGIAETDKQMALNQLKNVLTMAKVAAQLSESLNLGPEQVMDIFKTLNSRSLRTGAAEVVIKGDVSVARRLGVEGGLAIRFAPIAALNLAGSYSSSTTQAWGAEVRVSMAILSEDDKLAAEFIQRFQEREIKEPELLAQILPDIYPLLKEILSEPGTPVPTPD